MRWLKKVKVMTNYLVTGGAGFIGSHLTEKLVRLGAHVRVLDNLSTGKRSNLEPILDSIELVEGDVRDPDQCIEACRGIEVVFHQAALPSVPVSLERPRDSHDCNINGTFNLLLGAKQQKVRRVVYAASSSVYGDAPEPLKHEKIIAAPKSPYAVQKYTGELYGKAFYECYGLETISLRYFNVFGARQNPKSQYAAAIPAFITAILNDEPPTVYGDGEQTRDFTYIDNVVAGNLLAAKIEHTHGESINLACGERISINDTIAKINRLLGKQIQARYVDTRAGDVKHSRADITLAKQVLGFEIQVNFEQGLKRTIDYYRSMT